MLDPSVHAAASLAAEVEAGFGDEDGFTEEEINAEIEREMAEEAAAVAAAVAAAEEKRRKGQLQALKDKQAKDQSARLAAEAAEAADRIMNLELELATQRKNTEEGGEEGEGEGGDGANRSVVEEDAEVELTDRALTAKEKKLGKRLLALLRGHMARAKGLEYTRDFVIGGTEIMGLEIDNLHVRNVQDGSQVCSVCIVCVYSV
jgi:hypothetical protein